jgi:hypothetical protein
MVNFFRLLNRPEWLLLVTLVVYSFIPAVGGLLRMLEFAGGPAFVPPNPRAVVEPFPVIVHILASIVFCLAGALQFLPSIRRHRIRIHRASGRIVAAAGAVAALSGVWMTHFFAFPTELQGSLLYVVRIMLGLSMFGLIAWSLIAIRVGNVVGHRVAILRAYAIGQGASTQSFLLMAWMGAFGTEPLGPLRDVLMCLSWLVNLLVAELMIRWSTAVIRSRRNGSYATVTK